MQKNINISIINYKYFSGKYLIYESEGNVKKYNDYDDILLFEGRLNGKGKEYYYDGKLIFEGEYLNGLRNGKGKEYDRDKTAMSTLINKKWKKAPVSLNLMEEINKQMKNSVCEIHKRQNKDSDFFY